MPNKDSVDRVWVTYHLLGYLVEYLSAMDYTGPKREERTPAQIRKELIEADELKYEMMEGMIDEEMIRGLLAIIPLDSHVYFHEILADLQTTLAKLSDDSPG